MHTRLIQAYNKVSKVAVPKPGYLTVLNEENIYKSKTQLSKAIIDANPSFKSGGSKKEAIRIAPSGEAPASSREDTIKDFENTLKDINLVIREIKPKGEGASSRYPTYVVADSGSNEFQIVLAGGAASNEGMNYERNVMKSLKEYFTKKDLDEEVEKPEFLKELEQKLDVEFVGLIDSVDFTRKVERPLTDDGAEDMGKVIADAALMGDDDKEYYISIKDIGGGTVANTGAAGMFSVKDNQFEVDLDKKDIGKKLFKAAGIDNDESILKIERGLTDYAKKIVSPQELSETKNITSLVDKESLKKFIYSAFDYGYIYVRRKSAGLEIIDLTKKENLHDFIGDIKSVFIKYPFYKNDTRLGRRKNVSIIIETEEHRFSFDIRNASGGIIPTQINLVKLSSKKETAQLASNAKSVKSSNKAVADALTKI